MSFPVLQTERLLLRKVEQTDAADVLKGYSDPLVNQHMSVAYYSLEEVQAQLDFYNSIYETGTGTWWAICIKDDPSTVIGNGGLNNYRPQHRCVEIGYWLLPAMQGKGYAAEAVKAICRYAFEQLDVHRIEAIVEGGNNTSIKLLEKLGFGYEGTHRESELKNNRYIDLIYYAMFNPAH
ncbi:GNAT family N-acetyltransferase [Lacibacter sediminis]|uniref:GNAT family N-acetyltransferase n=1 Tax=Lacibacter sediminis TaxID=2760713 RepID=A0A7G5XD43_9BACT|nr:GNAT family protein [Lacibacter sediminis]QNA43396.1 GNAT family N-acetyltransferase [Lacibacter sediminis]